MSLRLGLRGPFPLEWASDAPIADAHSVPTYIKTHCVFRKDGNTMKLTI